MVTCHWLSIIECVHQYFPKLIVAIGFLALTLFSEADAASPILSSAFPDPASRALVVPFRLFLSLDIWCADGV